MFVWKLDLEERHFRGDEKWVENAERGYADESDEGGVLWIRATADEGKAFETREDAETFRAKWVENFEAQSGTVGVEGGEAHDVYTESEWELVEI